MPSVRKEYLYLNRLRESGVINMFLAGLPLQEEFGLSRNEAKQILMEWIQWVQKDPTNRDK